MAIFARSHYIWTNRITWSKPAALADIWKTVNVNEEPKCWGCKIEHVPPPWPHIYPLLTAFLETGPLIARVSPVIDLLGLIGELIKWNEVQSSDLWFIQKVVVVVKQSEETGVLPPGNQGESSPLTAAQNCMSKLKKTSSKIIIFKKKTRLSMWWPVWLISLVQLSITNKTMWPEDLLSRGVHLFVSSMVNPPCVLVSTMALLQSV